MTSQTATLSNFIDAASDRVARLIAGVRFEAARERELRDAEYRARLAEMDARLASVATLERQVADRLATIKDGDPGHSVTLEECAPIIEAAIERRVAEWPKPEPGKPGESVTLADVEPMIMERIAEAVAALPVAEPGKPGESVTVDDVRPLIADEVKAAVDALPPPEKGKDADPALVRSLVAETVAEAVAALPPPLKGDPGPVGSLPVVKAWEDRVHYQGECVTLHGATYQATKDTGREPPHQDWACLAAAGRDGVDGRSLNPTGLYNAGKDYARLDMVMVNGASFVAKRDDPGVCPGDGWYLLAAQGKRGNPGLRGAPGSGLRGLPGEPLVAANIDDNGLLILTNGDGSQVTCDLYPLLAKLQR